MDLGATVCIKSNPVCNLCPLNQDCLALKEGLVTALPSKNKPKSKPTKKVVWLLPQGPSGEVLLEKRKPQGIWGGLWSFIEAEKKKELELELTKRFKTDCLNIKKLNKVKHSFSHYNLEAIPYLAKLKSNKKYKNSVWVDYKNVGSLGLPAPIKKTINQITRP
jgi:A/G-specific adenine glycosylase|tara:strand:- start:51 stop:539 length:489 start_codon:yes stop_codon:yes gene_type:complete